MSVDAFLKTEIRTIAKEIISEMIEPIRVLKGFEDVEVLTLEEVCKVFRCTKDKMRDACNAGNFPHQKFGGVFIFPKKMIVDYLLGAWKSEKKVEPIRQSSGDIESMAARLVCRK